MPSPRRKVENLFAPANPFWQSESSGHFLNFRTYNFFAFKISLTVVLQVNFIVCLKLWSLMTGSRIFERFEKEWTEISKILFATGLFLEKGVNFFLDPLAVERLVGLTRPPIHKTRDVLQIVDKVKQLKFSAQFF